MRPLFTAPSIDSARVPKGLDPKALFVAQVSIQRLSDTHCSHVNGRLSEHQEVQGRLGRYAVNRRLFDGLEAIHETLILRHGQPGEP